MFGCNGNFYFPEIHFQLTKIYSFDPELILHFYFRFKSFPEKERVREREREREKREPRSEREREEEERAGAIVRRARRNKTAIDKQRDRLTSALIGRSRPSSIEIASALVDRRARSSIDERRDRPTSALVDRAASRTIAPISPPISSRAARSHLLLRCTDLLLRSRLHRSSPPISPAPI